MEIKVRGMTFDVYADGPEDGTPVLLLHGFPQDHREFDLILPRLHERGLRTYALDQRGYSPGARPPDVAAYDLAEPVADAVAVLDALGVDRAHVVGHDWGALVAWMLAAGHPDRVRTLVAISVPHPRGLGVALRNQPSQRLRFAYQKVFQSAYAERLLLARDAAVLRWMLKPTGPRAAQYVRAMTEPGRLTATLNWYRALSGRTLKNVGKVEVPTTYVWSDADATVGKPAALATASWVTGDYRLVTLRGIGHFVPEEAPRALAEVTLARIGV
ncbi:alpha/beta fold hydrolase [Actinoplanes sp. RD1]|uniref:alpha/beta fold hydrolase n=1 Tax=Actinoplanes sp. RD1 TaxID=3064538 RepID=UPI00274274D2|nr:alpha/beta hydrolase [Actinoplanes sp. RD1]